MHVTRLVSLLASSAATASALAPRRANGDAIALPGYATSKIVQRTLVGRDEPIDVALVQVQGTPVEDSATDDVSAAAVVDACDAPCEPYPLYHRHVFADWIL